MNSLSNFLQPALGHRPEALLLDFGGVIFETSKRSSGRADVASLLRQELRRAGHDLPADLLLQSVNAGLAALKDWKNAAGRRLAPAELSHREVMEDFLVSDLPEPARATLAGSAGTLLDDINSLLSDHAVRPGIPELLQTAQQLDVRVGIVSNAHSGRAHRRLLRESGLEPYVAVQVYSDEVGIRKPNPQIIALAAQALGTTADHSWYVGDTQDRDVTAGRRAGCSAVILTRCHHTDNPPYAVSERADAIFDTPEDLIRPLRDSRAHARPTAPARAADLSTPSPVAINERANETARLPAAILLDHGGVISTSTKKPVAQQQFTAHVSAQLRAAGHRITGSDLWDALRRGQLAHKAWKGRGAQGAGIPEITPTEYWCDLVGADLPAGVRTWLRAESANLSFEYASIKSVPKLRDGIVELLDQAQAQQIPVAVVSNTICGRAVRAHLDAAGLADRIGVHIYSDELGYRKPDPAMPREALRALDVDPADCWFVGDKPGRDMAAAHAAGIRTAILVRGGSLNDAALEPYLAATDGPEKPDLVATSMRDLVAWLQPTSIESAVTS